MLKIGSLLASLMLSFASAGDGSTHGGGGLMADGEGGHVGNSETLTCALADDARPAPLACTSDGGTCSSSSDCCSGDCDYSNGTKYCFPK